MCKYDDWIQSEEDSELLIYEEYQQYVEQVRWEKEEDWEDWVNSIGWSD
jgi:heme-degrading monooxygenase HmoA